MESDSKYNSCKNIKVKLNLVLFHPQSNLNIFFALVLSSPLHGCVQKKKKQKQKLAIEGKHLNIIKAVFENPTPDTILKWELRVFFSSKIRNKNDHFHTSIQGNNNF